MNVDAVQGGRGGLGSVGTGVLRRRTLRKVLLSLRGESGSTLTSFTSALKHRLYLAVRETDTNIRTKFQIALSVPFYMGGSNTYVKNV